MTPEELYFKNEALVYHVLNKKFPMSRFDDDFQQIARLGLWKACLSYNETKGKFSTYAVPCIANQIKMELRKMGRKPIEVSLEALVKDTDKNSEQLTISGMLIGEQNVGFIDTIWVDKELTDRQKRILSLLYDGMVQADIAREIGISQTMVSREVSKIRNIAQKYI